MWERMLWAACLGAGALSAHAETATTTTTPVTVPVISCAGCSAAQMQTKAATQPVGLVFVYDLNASVMRKYVVIATRRAAPRRQRKAQGQRAIWPRSP